MSVLTKRGHYCMILKMLNVTPSDLTHVGIWLEWLESQQVQTLVTGRWENLLEFVICNLGLFSGELNLAWKNLAGLFFRVNKKCAYLRVTTQHVVFVQ